MPTQGPARRSQRRRRQERGRPTTTTRSNAYVSNVFYDVPKMFAVFEPSGRWHGTLEGFRRALAMRGSIGDPGEVAAQPPLRDAANHDFRPTAAARGKGVRVFVPWGLYATVAEWDFYHAGNDPTLILDDHFHWPRTSLAGRRITRIPPIRCGP